LPSLEAPPVAQPLWGKLPSWSWASLNTPIVFATHRHPLDTVELCEIKVLPAVQHDVLEIRGPLIPMDWVKTCNDKVESQAFWKAERDEPIFERSPKDGAIWRILTQEDHWFAQYCYASGQPYFNAIFDQVLFMPILFEAKRGYTRIRASSQFSPYARIIGLLLRAEVAEGRGTFRRVGTAQFMPMRPTDNVVEMFRALTRTYQGDVSNENFRHTDGRGFYTIWLV
jgi:hypothetical protein